MRAFIVRPFGVKQDIDFDAVQRDLIGPALTLAGLTGDTTAEILEAGNIRADMFQLLLLADLVVADVSIDNANVFYELGVRHALRNRRTVMIRARGMPTIPFDLRTDRYLEYDRNAAGATVDTLAQTLMDTVASQRVDSPVFAILPDLREPNRSRMMPVPREFREEVERAAANREIGRLGLLGWEAQGFAWESEGFRIVGRSLIQLKAYEASRRLWERVRALDQTDIEANLMLGTVYQRLGDLPSSDQALKRVLENPDSEPPEQAEAYALLGRNDKSRLCESWSSESIPDRQKDALGSRFLMSAYANYRRSFVVDLNHFYSGLNALALLSMALELARKQPDVWKEQFDTDDDADSQSKRLEKERGELAGAVGLSLNAAKERLKPGTRDIWLDLSLADHQFLVGGRRAASAYRAALDGAAGFHRDSARAQLILYRDLGIFADRLDVCLAEFPEPAAPQASVQSQRLERAIVFTGHRVDEPGRPNPRFPQEKVEIAREAIRTALTQFAQGEPEACLAFAGGASGGDLLFHEVCHELGIESRLRLALPVGRFIARSVAPSNADWEARFDAVAERLRDRTAILALDEEIPSWLRRKRGYNIWGRTNVWLLEEALGSGAPVVHLLALWDGNAGDGSGGTADLIELARKQGVITRVIDTNQLFA